jgi:hypothetical protein
MQRSVVEAEGIRVARVASTPMPRSDLVQAAMRSLTQTSQQARQRQAEWVSEERLTTSPRSDDAALPAVEANAVRVTFNILPPEPDFPLPPGVSAELAHQRAEVAALEQAEAELRGLGAHREELQAQVRQSLDKTIWYFSSIGRMLIIKLCGA